MPRGVYERHRTTDPKLAAMTRALNDAPAELQDIYRRQCAHVAAQQGRAIRFPQDFDPDTMQRVAFVPRARGGGYDATLRPVAGTLEEARKDGKDFFHPERGWLLWGTKAVSDIDNRSTPVILSREREREEVEA